MTIIFEHFICYLNTPHEVMELNMWFKYTQYLIAVL